MRPIAWLSLVLLFSSIGSASAQPAVAVDAPPPPRGDQRTEIDIGYLVGAGDIGTSTRFQRGLQLDIGRRFGNLALLAEYGYLVVGRYEATGSLSRLGLVTRYSLLRTLGTPDQLGKRAPISGDLWIEGGAGAQRITWHDGGRLTRPDIVLGFGVQLDGVFRRDSDEPTWSGPYVAFRAILSRGPEHGPEVMSACGGPCDQATRPSRNDAALFFHFGLNWGR